MRPTRIKSLHLHPTWPVPKRTENLVSTAQIGGFHPLDRPAKQRVIVTAVGRWLLAADEPCRNRWIEFVGVAGEIGQHLGELIIHEVAPLHPKGKIPSGERRSRCRLARLLEPHWLDFVKRAKGRCPSGIEILYISIP